MTDEPPCGADVTNAALYVPSAVQLDMEQAEAVCVGIRRVL